MTNDYKSVWRDWFDSNPRGRSSLWVEGSIPSSLTERGAHTCIYKTNMHYTSPSALSPHNFFLIV